MTAAGADGSPDADVDRLLSGLTRFLLFHSAEGAFELRDTAQAVGRAYGAQAEILAMAEGAVLTVRHTDGPVYHDTVRVGPELTRLDLVSKAKFLVTVAGNPRVQGFNDIRDATSETVALTLGLIAGAVPAAAIAAYRRRARQARPADGSGPH
jgi:hypothetical protein